MVKTALIHTGILNVCNKSNTSPVCSMLNALPTSQFEVTCQTFIDQSERARDLCTVSTKSQAYT